MTIVRVADTETTGLDPDTDVVIETGHVDVTLPARTISDPVSRLYHAATLPPENRAIHHIMPSQLAGREPFDAAAWDAECKADGVTAIVAHNAQFDTQFLHPTIPVICTMKCAMRVWPDAPAFGNQVLRYWLDDAGKLPKPFNHAHASPVHRAGPDAFVTAHIFVALLNEGVTGKQMVEWTKEPALMPRCPMGSDKGKPWAEVDAGLLRWICGKADLSEDVRWCAQREIDRRAG